VKGRRARAGTKPLQKRQQQLRDELRRTGGAVARTEARREVTLPVTAFDRGRCAPMDVAEANLREGDLARRSDNQSQAMEALQQRASVLGEAMAEGPAKTSSPDRNTGKQPALPGQPRFRWGAAKAKMESNGLAMI